MTGVSVYLQIRTNIFCGEAQLGTKWSTINHWLCLRFCNHWAQITQAMNIILRLLHIRVVSSTTGSAFGGYEILNERCLLLLQLVLD